ncbi:hypothetical protein [Ideonella sp. A 288]|uniref:hypothetical protein n=1 Tax=Ideonella sp. A 288 TaxID=1962181 RepID=UPI000B4A637B|nr:hypothetical protein [Ideonella sp. A 288]
MRDPRRCPGPATALVLVLVLALSPLQALAQSSLPGPTTMPTAAAQASAPTATRPAPRAQTAVERRDGATEPGELGPARPVIRQFTIPLGPSTPPVPKPPARPDRRGQAASAAGIDDAVARCEAQSDARQRAACRAKLANRSPRR